MDQSLRSLAIDPPEHPETATELQLAIARVQRHLGLGSESRKTLEAAADSLPGGMRDPDLEIRLRLEQARNHILQGEPEAARQVASRMLEKMPRLHDRRWVERAAELRQIIAASYYYESRREKNRELLEAELASYADDGLSGSPIELETRRLLGKALEAEGYFERALSMYSSVLEARRRLLPEAHPELLEVMSEVHMMHLRMEDLDQAEKLAREIADMTPRLYGADSLAQAEALRTLALVEADRGKVEQAIERLRASVEIKIAALGGKHKAVAMEWFNIRVDFLGALPGSSHKRTKPSKPRSKSVWKPGLPTTTTCTSFEPFTRFS